MEFGKHSFGVGAGSVGLGAGGLPGGLGAGGVLLRSAALFGGVGGELAGLVPAGAGGGRVASHGWRQVIFQIAAQSRAYATPDQLLADWQPSRSLAA